MGRYGGSFKDGQEQVAIDRINHDVDELKARRSVFQAVNKEDQDFSVADVRVNWREAQLMDIGYSHDFANTPDIIVISEAGYYRITHLINYVSNRNRRIMSRSYIELNGTEVEHSQCISFNYDDTDSNRNTTFSSFVIGVDAGTQLVVHCEIAEEGTAFGDTTADYKLEAEKGSLTIERIY